MTFAKYNDEWETRLGLAPGTLHRALWGLWWKELEVGAIPQQEYDDHVGQELGLPDHEAVCQFYDDYFGKDYLDQQVVDAVRSLRDRYKVAMLTNAFPGHAKMVVDRYGYDPQAEYDVYVNSALVKLAKPDPAIYQLTLEQLDVAPAEAVFLDDQVRNIDAAQALGIHGVVFADTDSGLKELEGLLGHKIL
jgi:putative hydrolase of the HAD superfamily